MSGSLIGAAIGVGLSFATGGLFTPAMGFMFGSLVGGMLFPPAGPSGPRLNDLKAQSSEYGRPIPVIYGTVALGGNVIWASDLIEVEGDSGGKGGGESSIYTYYANFAVALCEGEAQLGRIWAGPEKRLIWDGNKLEGEDEGALLRFYSGSETQLPDALIESYEGVGNVEAFRGTAYLVLEHFPVAKDGNRIPFLTVEVGNVTVTPDVLNGDMAYSWAERVLVTNDYYIAFVRGMNPCIVIRSLTADGATVNPFVTGFDKEFFYWALGNRATFFDETRRVIVMTHQTPDFGVTGGGAYDTFNIDTHEINTVTFAETPGAANCGLYITGGVLHPHTGKYVFLGSGSGSGGFDRGKRPTVYVVDPDDPAVAEATYSYGAVNDVAMGPLFAPPFEPPSGWGVDYVCGFQRSGLFKYPLWPATASVPFGTGADLSGAAVGDQATAAIDPTTGYIWSWNLNADYSFDVWVNDPVLEVNVAATTVADFFKEVYSVAFNGTTAVFSGLQLHQPPRGGEWDAYATYLASDGSFGETTAGGAIWLSHPTYLIWNPVQETYHEFHRGGVVTTGLPSVPGVTSTLNYAGDGGEGVQGTYDDVAWPSNYNLGEYDRNASMNRAPVTLASIVSDLSVRAGLTTGQVDVTALTDLVDGYAVANQTTVRDAITVLMPAYFFDAVESDGKVKFVKRGGAIAVVIPDEDVGAFESGSEPPEPIETTRRMENELPRTMNVKYLQEATDYSQAVRVAKRLVGASGDEQTMEVPVVMSDTKAQEVAEVNLHGAWVARLTYSFTAPRKYGYLEPTDIVVVYGYTMRLTKTVNADGIIKCEAVHDDSNVYVPNVIVTETPPSDKTVATSVETTLELA